MGADGPSPSPRWSPSAEAAAAPSDLGHIAGVVKAAREARGLTQRQMAAQVGVSAGLIGQIETGRTRPSVSTLLDIARVLGLTLDALFKPTDAEGSALAPPPKLPRASHLPPGADDALAPSGASVASDTPSPPPGSHLSRLGHIDEHVVRSNARETITMEAGVQWELLTPEVDHEVSFMLVTYPPGSASSMSRHLLRHDDNEYFYLLEGVLQVRLAFEETTLYQGDAMSFDSTRPHQFENRAETQARGVWSVVRKGRAH